MSTFKEKFILVVTHSRPELDQLKNFLPEAVYADPLRYVTVLV